MSNTIGVSITLAANNVLAALKTTLAPLSAFSVDFSSNMAQKGTAIQVPLASAKTGDADQNDYEDLTGGTMAIKTVTLDTYWKSSGYLGDIDADKLGDVPFMESQLIEDARAVVKHVVADVMAGVTAANFGDAIFNGPASNFGYDDMVDINTGLSELGVPGENRSIILPAAYKGAIIKDTKISNAAGVGTTDPIQNAVLPVLANMRVIECENVPANSQNLVGFATHPTSFAVAMRPPKPQMGMAESGGHFQVVTDPETGVSLGFRWHYSNATGRIHWTFDTYYGKEFVRKAGLRITNA